MNKSVKVTADKAGIVVNISKNNADYGYVRVSQVRAVFEGGWTRKKTLSALISGTVEDLKDLGFKAGMELPGKIQIVEQLDAFNTDNPEKDYKIAGDTGVVCCVDGQPIFRKTFYSDDEQSQDTMLKHNNTEDIKARYAELVEAEEVSTEEKAKL
jgi:hypothetical protein